MQKVITVTTHTNIIGDELFVETEYPQLNKYLKDGYNVVETIPILKPADASYLYAITFVLKK